ncbi:MAG: hypothetical protein EXQ56_06235 [Acidobacteria bacterium]|nr:hypothetical protein [Acidobacteriota bacterium]
MNDKVLYAMALLLALAAPVARAQSNGVSLGNVSAGVKSNVIVPLMLDLESEDVRVGSITATVGYSPTIVTFDRAEKGFLLDGVSGKFKATAKVSGEKSEIQVEIFTEGEPRKPLRKGLTLSLIFKINDSATLNTKMPLTLSNVQALTLDPEPKPVQPLAVTAGMIEVLSPENVPFVSCFFFTH